MKETIENIDFTGAVKSWFQTDNLIKNLPFLLLVIVLGVLYIANAHYHLQLERKIDKQEDVVKKLGWEYMTTKSDVMFQSKQSEVAKAVSPLGLKPLTEPPKIIEITE